MNKLFLITLLSTFSFSVMAGNCMLDVRSINGALENMELSDEQR